MRNLALPFALPSFKVVLVSGIVLLAAVAIGPLFVILRVGVREIAIFTLGILMGLLILIPTERIVKYGFVLWMLTFAFGWRTIYFTTDLNIHPSEILVVLLFIATAIRSIIRRNKLDLSIPNLISLIMVFGFIGILTAIARGNRIDIVIEESKAIFSLVPSYLVVKWLIVSRKDWEQAAWLTIPLAVYVSALGVMDLLAPGLTRAVSGNASVITAYQADSVAGGSAFTRVGFIFYGSFTAGFLIFTFFGFSVYNFLSNFRKGLSAQLLNGSALLIELFGIYLSGFRGIWYAMVVFLFAYAVSQRRAWILVGAAIASIPALPSEFVNRFLSLFITQYADSSQFDRINRASQAIELIKQSPLTGVGWSGSGYVHSDLIQFAANLGLPALAVFVAWLLNLIWRIRKLINQPSWIGPYAQPLFATLCGLVVIFAGEGLIVWQQLMIPIWFVIAMSYKLIELNAQEQAAIVSTLVGTAPSI